MADDTLSIADLCARADAAIATSQRLKAEAAALQDASRAYVALIHARLDQPLLGSTGLASLPRGYAAPLTSTVFSDREA
ncbi:hypothetical protein [Methylobacterium oxalidis]|uniref:hypothetical protein n=1 Tax=Methylobacterium oxalidis TaxID=944322 RepID=UPI003315C5BE